jgi:hypothetical protein
MMRAETKREDTMMDYAITRRSALGTAAIGVAVLGATPALAQASARKTFVLVHGAWHGGWCWRRVADILEKHGHKVYAQSLTGNGDRAHLLTKDVVLDTHIADIVNLVTWEDLRDICLVAHSYGGWPASGALEHIHDRVGSIVWLDAFKPEDGQKGHRLRLRVQPQGAGRGGGERRARPQGAAGKDLLGEREGFCLDRLQAHPAAERRRHPADPAYRQARDDRQEDLHPCGEVSAGRIRQGAGRVPSRQDLADLRQRGERP